MKSRPALCLSLFVAVAVPRGSAAPAPSARPRAFRIRTTSAASLRLPPELELSISFGQGAAEIKLQSPGGKAAWIKPAAGAWRQCAATGALTIPLAELPGGEFAVLVDKPDSLDLNDSAAPEVESVTVDGEEVSAPWDLGYVGSLPKAIAVRFRDALNPIDPAAVQVVADDRPVARDKVVSRAQGTAGRTATVSCDLAGVLKTERSGVRTLRVAASDIHFATPAAEAVVKFRTEPDFTLADGTGMLVDSVHKGYEDLSVLFDGKGMTPGKTTYGCTWASEEEAAAHWFELLFPAEREIRGLDIQWANYKATWWTSSCYDIQKRVGQAWETVLAVKDNPPAPTSSHTVVPFRTRRLRVVVPAGGGHRERPDIFWVSEITVR